MGFNLSAFSLYYAVFPEQGETTLDCLVMSYFEIFCLFLVAEIIPIDNILALYIPRPV